MNKSKNKFLSNYNVNTYVIVFFVFIRGSGTAFLIMQLAELLIELGFKNVKVNHSDNVDVSADLHGETYGFKYEHADSHNKPEIISKKERGLLNRNHILFIGSAALTILSFVEINEK